MICVLLTGTSTAVCCLVRTALSGAQLDPDLSCKLFCAFPSLYLKDPSFCLPFHDSGAITTSVGWRLPEVNIGIFCANAPVIRPLYLFFQGRLVSQKVSRMTAASKEGGVSWPSDTTRFGVSSTAHGNQLSDGGVSLEMGLADHMKDGWKRGSI